jgi:hypothetical protein
MHGAFPTLLSMFGGHSEGQFDDLLAGFAPPNPKASLGIGLSHELVSGLLSRRLFCARSSLASGHFVNCSFFGQRWSVPPGGSTMARRAGICPSNGAQNVVKDLVPPRQQEGQTCVGRASVVVTCNLTVCRLELFVV